MFPYRRLPSHITGLYVFTVANFILFFHLAIVQGDISVRSIDTNETVYPNIPDVPAYFGMMIPSSGIQGQVVYSSPPNACSPIAAPPVAALNSSGLQWFVLIRRNDCSFSQKVLNAQKAGYAAAIVHNVNSDELEPMGPSQSMIVSIPSVFIGESSGLIIMNRFTYEKGFYLYVDDKFPDIFWPFTLDRYLLPFAVMLVICFMVTICTLVFKCIRDHRQRQRHRLPTRLLKKLPIRKFKRGDQYEVCAICLDDYREGEKLRLLPCSHTYHIKCIDPWLTENRRNCPVCKRKVLLGQRRERPVASSESDSSGNDDDDSGRSAPTESTPLLNPTVYSNVYGSGNSTAEGTTSIYGTGEASSAVAGDASVGGSSSWHSSLDANYQSFATPMGSPTALMANSSVRSAATSLISSLLPAPVGGDLMSSGEHSVNGDVVDFSHIGREEESGDGPVEIAIDIAARQQPSLDRGPFGQWPVPPASASPGRSQDMVV